MHVTLFATFALALVTFSCSNNSDDGPSSDVGGTGGGDGDDVGDGDGDGDGDNVGELDVTDADGGDSDSDSEDCTPPTADATLVGKVLSPNLEIPISGALVYLTRDDVEPVPDGVYCAQCVELTCDERYVLSNPDGSFELPAVSGTGWKLVVQKGQFLRVVEMDVSAGSNAVPETQSSLPSQWNPDAGMWIPRIAVYQTSPDAVYNVLAKFGMGTVSEMGALSVGTEAFTMLDDSDQGAFLDDPEEMNKHHIIFLPCASTKFWTDAPLVPEERIKNIQDYVATGGKLYATDHSNEYIDEPFPTYQTFHLQDRDDDDRDIQPAYSNTAQVVDSKLLAWLTALKDTPITSSTLGDLPNIPTVDNFSGLDAVHEVLVEDDAGDMVNVGHHTWVEGACGSCSDAEATRPMAVSGSYGCGRMMFSTFEASSDDHVGMSAQELTLLYMILEIGVCHKESPPDAPVIVR